MYALSVDTLAFMRYIKISHTHLHNLSYFGLGFFILYVNIYFVCEHKTKK